MTMRVTLVVAAAENGVIGRDGGIPWRIRDDLRRFKRLTIGHTVIMGRKTWESLPKRPLVDRVNVVVTRQRDYAAPGAVVAASLEDALDATRARGESDAFVVGGGEIYRLALPVADRVELTVVHADVDGDATFPPLDPAEWAEVAREEHEEPASEPGAPPLRYAYVTLERRERAHGSHSKRA